MHRSVAFALICFVVACEQPPAAATSPSQVGAEALASHGAAHHKGPVSSSVQRQIARLREVTAPFHDFEAAAKAGWGSLITGCFSDPKLGGMGYHYGNVGLIDGTVDALQPELLLYEPTKNGKLRFVAVEFIVPFTAWTSPEPPSLYGQSFHRNEAFGLWVLHVWHFRHNPAGLFADWNPEVSCAFATVR
jgi:hypothetical protein